MSMEIKIPDIGDFDSVEVIEVLVEAGESVSSEQALIVLESDKATMEVPCPADGVLQSLSVQVGDKVAQGDVIGTLEAGSAESEADAETPEPEPDTAEAESPASAEPPSEPPAAAPAPAPKAEPAKPAEVAVTRPADGDLPHASPAVRKFARELGVDLTQVSGTGPKERILKDDVQGFVKQRMSGTSAGAAPGSGAGLPQMPAVDFSKFGETETKPLSRIRKLSAANLHRNWVVVPHVTQFDTADITDLEAFRKSESTQVKLTLLPFVLKAAALALKAYPEFNSSLAPDGASLILKKYCNVGFAADTEHGLVVPVIRDVDRKSVTELAAEAGELAATARDGKLSPAQMQGGCFSISSLGGIGGSHFTPIINAPEVAILGVSRAKTEATWDGQQFQPRLQLPLSLSYDHRVIDGAAAARFVVYMAQLLSDVRRLCL